MEIGERIKKRREDLGLTQEDLAIMLGYKNRSTVNKWEKDGSKLRQSKIAEIAEALNTTPAYLMGWDDDPTDYDSSIYIPKEYQDERITPEQLYKSREIGFEEWERERAHMEIVENPDIRMIARAGRKMTKEQAELLRRYAEFTFPEAFKDIQDEEE